MSKEDGKIEFHEALTIEASTLAELAAQAQPGALDLFGDPIQRETVKRHVRELCARLADAIARAEGGAA